MNENDRLVRAINDLTREICKLKEQVRDLNYIQRQEKGPMKLSIVSDGVVYEYGYVKKEEENNVN